MNTVVEAILGAYEARAAEEQKLIEDMEQPEFVRQRDNFLLGIGHASGQLVNLLAREAKAQIILEIGSSYGYSTLWLAEAASMTGGKVVSLEFHVEKQEYARSQIAKAGLADFVDFRLGDARETIAALGGPIDFVLLDLWKDLYIPCFELFYPKLSPGALIVADNMLLPESARHEAARYRMHVRSKSDIESVLLPVGSGIELSRFTHGMEAPIS